MKCHRFIIVIVIILALAHISLLCEPVYAIEPQRPNVSNQFSQEEEAKVKALKSLKTKEAFNRLKDVEFLINRKLTYKAIHTAFKNRKSATISYAQNFLKLPLIEYVDGRRITRTRDFNIAKKIFEVFPDYSTPIIVTLYNTSDETTQGNIIRASGKVSGGPPVKDMLIKALDNKSFAEEVTPELFGQPLRVCDIAYNQIVLRYGVRNILRTISSAHKIETRNHHIQVLKKQALI